MLVTGATGFIGGALARRLAAEGALVTGTGRHVERAPPGLAMVAADLRDTAAMAGAVAGQEVVFHVAAWLGSDRPNPDPARAVNVDAVESLVRASVGVQRFVQVSSVAVYGPPPDGEVAEDAPLDTGETNDEYGRTKALGEQAALRLGRELGVPVTVVRPGMVYGPGSRTWTLGMARLVKKGVPVLTGAGDDHAGLVYVDDLVDLLLLAGERRGAVGEAFNGVGPPVTWADFFGHYGRMVGRRPRAMPMFVAAALAAVNSVVPLGLPLTRQRLQHLRAKPVYSHAKAERLLGWTPRTSLDRGMAASEAWLRESGTIS